MSLIKPAVLNPEDLDLNAERTPIPSPNEPSSFFKEVTKLFDELLREYRTTLSIRAYGQEVEWEMLAWMRARLKEDLVSKSENIPRQVAEIMIDSLDVVPASDKEPGKVFETMICRVLSKDVIQQPLKLLSDHFSLFLANPPASISDKDMDRYKKQQACISRILEVFDDVNYQFDQHEYLTKIMEIESELKSQGPLPDVINDLDSDVLNLFGKYS